MDSLKVGDCAHAPENLEKGCSESHPLHSEACGRQTRGRQTLAKRHLVALGGIALIWLAFTYGMHAFEQPRHIPWSWDGDDARFAQSEDGKYVDQLECMGSTNWTTYYDQPPWTPEYPLGAETTFSFPSDSDAFYLLSRGLLQHGQVNIEQSEDVGDVVDVRIRVAYRDDKALEHASVCQIGKTDREHGVGIFTSRWAPHPRLHKPGNELEFDVTLTLPASSEGPLSVKKLVTKMSNYNQNVADLQASVLFDKISLVSANGRLSVQSVTSDFGRFYSVNGKIDGHFNSRSLLDLHLMNGRSTPTVNLLHREGAGSSGLALHTMNGQIDAEISLTSDTSTGGEFEVDAQTRNGEIGLKFARTPVDSVLRCRAETTVGNVQVELDSAFEGVYSLQTVVGAKLTSQHDVEDPAGKGRRRVVTQKEAGGRVKGELKWVDSDGGSSGNKGSVVLKAVVQSVKLVF